MLFSHIHKSHLMDPELLHGAWFLHGIRCWKKHTLNYTCEISQVEQVMWLGRGGQKVLKGLFVHLQCTWYNLLSTSFEFIAEWSVGDKNKSNGSYNLRLSLIRSSIIYYEWKCLQCHWLDSIINCILIACIFYYIYCNWSFKGAYKKFWWGF